MNGRFALGFCFSFGKPMCHLREGYVVIDFWCYYSALGTFDFQVLTILCFKFLVKEAVQKAELDASLAAQDAVKHGHKAESRVERIRGSAEPSHESNDETADYKPNQTSRKHATLGTLYMSI